MKITSWRQVSDHWECRVLLDRPLSLRMINSIAKPIRSAGAVLLLPFFQDYCFYSCSSRPTENMLFKVNQLQNEFFVSLFF